MHRDDINVPQEVRAVRAALWAGPRDAGLTIGLFGPGPDRTMRGFTENVLVGNFMVTLGCSAPRTKPEECEFSITVSDMTPGRPARTDGYVARTATRSGARPFWS